MGGPRLSYLHGFGRNHQWLNKVVKRTLRYPGFKWSTITSCWSRVTYKIHMYNSIPPFSTKIRCELPMAPQKQNYQDATSQISESLSFLDISCAPRMLVRHHQDHYIVRVKTFQSEPSFATGILGPSAVDPMSSDMVPHPTLRFCLAPCRSVALAGARIANSSLAKIHRLQKSRLVQVLLMH